MRQAALIVAVGAAAVLVGWGPASTPEPPPDRAGAATAWPRAQRAEMTVDPSFTPRMFLDARTAIGTAPGRLLLHTDGQAPRVLRRVTAEFEAFAADAGRIVWAESSGRDPKVRLWTAVRAGGPARLLTADTGHAVFSGNQNDLVIAGGRVHWAAAPGTAADRYTEIRSVPLDGGPVSTRIVAGRWSLSAWPWLVAENSDRLRNLVTGAETAVVAGGADQLTCGPVWCRVMVLGGPDGLAGIDAMHPDGSGRRRIAGPSAQAAVNDVAVLDRFEILARTTPASDLNGTADLVVADLSTGRTVDVAASVDGAFTAGGMLWWSTSRGDDVVWHTLDLRTA